MSCGGSAHQTAPDIEREKSWEEMVFSERRAYMATAVMPQMKSLFQAFDPLRYEDFSCETCHGPDPAGSNFEMPSAHILKLHPTGSPEQEAMVESQREMVTFMYQKVVPTMTELLDAEPWSDETKSGFGCFGCHTRADSDTPTASDAQGSTAP